ncbi:MAG: OmpH family outer membrane protein [Pirellulaceae bacterium]|nr:OmpH family outer membrane protein [Pirellulaceae bacterium]
MRLSFRYAAAAACISVLSALSGVSQAQGPQPGLQPGAARPAAPAVAQPASYTPPSGTNVAVIDIAFVFKNHDRFNAAMADIKKDIDQFEAYVKGEQQKLKAKAEELQQFTPGSNEFRTKEADLARVNSELQILIGQKRREFLEQEARVYFRIYQEIEQSVTTFAQRAKIGLVLRFSRDEMKESDRASVLQGVNRAVVYHQGLEITIPILEDLNRRPFNPNAAPPSPTGTPAAAAANGGGPAGRVAQPQIPGARKNY